MSNRQTAVYAKLQPLKAMTVMQRRAFRLYLDGLKDREIAAQFGLTRNAISQRRARARRRLAAMGIEAPKRLKRGDGRVRNYDPSWLG